jgi:hypothetical protein
MKLFHGSNIEIDKIDLGRCRPWKDFGRGFYTSPSQDQALKMAERTVRIYGGRPCVTAFAFDDDLLANGPAATSLKIKIFGGPDNEWARFVVNNRNREFRDKQSPNCNIDAKYDIVLGPVANDDIAALIDVFLSGLVSDDVLTKELTFRELSNQVSFHTEKAVAFLRKTEAYHET